MLQQRMFTAAVVNVSLQHQSTLRWLSHGDMQHTMTWYIWRLFRNIYISLERNGLAKTISHFGCHNEISLTWNLTRRFPSYT